VGQTVYIDAITIFFFECSLQNIKIIYQEAGIKKIILSEHYFIDRNVMRDLSPYLIPLYRDTRSHSDMSAAYTRLRSLLHFSLFNCTRIRVEATVSRGMRKDGRTKRKERGKTAVLYRHPAYAGNGKKGRYDPSRVCVRARARENTRSII